MKVEYINAFVTSAANVFHTMLACELTRGEPFLKNGFQPEQEVSGIIGLSGRAKGTVVLSLSPDTATRAATALLAEEFNEIDADVVDAVGELTNIITGQAKAQLAHLDLRVGLPTVIIGKQHSVEFPKKATPICIPFTCDWGTIAVEVGLVEQPAAVAEALDTN